MRIILGSQSYIRKQALEGTGLAFEVIPSHFDETSITEQEPGLRALKLAEAKARVVGSLYPEALIIASDAFVHRNDELFEKPKDLGEAKAMLKSLSGTSFEFTAGLTVFNGASGKLLSGVDSCRIEFRELSEEEIDGYIITKPVLKCAGAFENTGVMCFARSISGAFIVNSGFSMCRLSNYLSEYGISMFSTCSVSNNESLMGSSR